jgi:hypothetical protein
VSCHSNRQECTAPVTPETRLDFPEATASCNGNPNPAIVSHAVQLGLSCTGGTTYFIDAAFECSNASYSFDYLDAKTASLSVAADRRFSCLQHAAVPSGSTVTIPSVAIQTDDYWRTDPFSTCYTRNTPPPVPTTTVTLSPTSTSLPPTAVPTPTVITSTLDSPSGMPSNAPGEAVTPAPTMAAQKLAPATRAPVSLAPTSIVRSAAPSIRAIASGPMPPLSFPSFDNENTDPDGEILDNKAFVFGVAVGGGTFVLVCAALILYLVVRHCNCHRHSPTNKSSGMATSSHHKFNELLDHDASSKDHSTTTNNKDNRDVEPGRVANHELSETSYSSAPPSPSPSARLHRNLSTPHKTVDYKDQVRSVLPMIHAEPTDATITASAEMVDGGSSNVAATHSHAALSALRYGSENNPAVDLMVTATAMSPPIATPTVNGGRRRALEP